MGCQERQGACGVLLAVLSRRCWEMMQAGPCLRLEIGDWCLKLALTTWVPLWALCVHGVRQDRERGVFLPGLYPAAMCVWVDPWHQRLWKRVTREIRSLGKLYVTGLWNSEGRPPSKESEWESALIKALRAAFHSERDQHFSSACGTSRSTSRSFSWEVAQGVWGSTKAQRALLADGGCLTPLPKPTHGKWDLHSRGVIKYFWSLSLKCRRGLGHRC